MAEADLRTPFDAHVRPGALPPEPRRRPPSRARTLRSARTRPAPRRIPSRALGSSAGAARRKRSRSSWLADRG
jgi:hypothetical protein